MVYLVRKIKQLFHKIGFSIFRFFKFLIDNKYILLILLALGFTLGYVYDKYTKTAYKTEIIVIPNFNSTEYLYSEIENFKSNIPQSKKEKFFLDNIVNIEIAPIVDVKSFIENGENREFLKVLSENGEKFEQVLKNKNILKSNKVHLIILTTKSKNYTNQIVQFLLDNLNNSKYFVERQTFEIENLKENKIQLKKSIEQINQILDRLGKEGLSSSGKELNINTYDQLNSVIDLKKNYINEISKIDTKLIEFQKIVYPINVSFNNEPVEKIYLKAKIIFPLGLIIIFFLYSFSRLFYKKYSDISNEIDAK
ncbi:hypothetical protein [Empedobacter brevis]|uniref:hypothetical protein n=1 Tax=Empedobacter brevis TaxID=247 RepID=UPI00289DD6B5|nr:hypothetical protein [Empedobacter brevis]